MRRHLIVGALAAAVLFISGPASAGPKDVLLATDKAFSDMSVAKGPHAAFLAYMADNVRLYDGDHPPIVGKSAAADYYAKTEKLNPSHAASRLEWTPVEADISPDGALGWTRGTWIWSAKKADGTALKSTGYYVTEWRRQADGTYKFELDIGGADKS